MIIRSVLVLAALTAAIVYGLMAFSHTGRSPAPSTTTTAVLPGGWPADPDQLHP